MSGRASRGAKFLLIALEVAGALLALAAGLAVLLFWRLQSGPVSLALFKQSAEFAVERSLPRDHRARIEQAVLARGGERGDYVVSLEGLHIEDPDGERIADLASATLVFSVNDMAAGEFGPRVITLTSPTLRIVRGRDRRFTLDYAESRERASSANVFELLTGGPVFRGAFERAELVDAKVFFHDIGSARSWSADAAVARIERKGDAYAARLDGVFDIEGEAASLSLDALYRETTELITAEVDVERAPVGDILEMFFGERAGVFDAPLTGAASIMLTRSGEVISSRLSGRAENGVLRLGDRAAPVRHVGLVANFDPRANRFDIERFDFDVDGSRGSLAGEARIAFAGDALTPSRLDMRITGADILIDTHGALPEPLPLERFSTALAYDFSSRRVALSDLEILLAGAALSGDVSYQPARDAAGAPVSPAVKASLAVEGAVERETLLGVWPESLGAGAREFIRTRMPKGRAENIRFALDLPAGAKKPGGPMPDGAMALDFDVVGATVVYAPTMPPLTGARGKGLLTGNAFKVTELSGKVQGLAVDRGEVEFTALTRAAPTFYRFSARGPARAMLSVLNRQPLNVLDAAGLSPEQFASGVIDARVEIERPNLRDVPQEQYRYSGEASFRDLTISEFYRASDIENGEGKIRLDTDLMTVQGEATLGGAPISIAWTQRLGEGEERSHYVVSGVVDSSTGDVFGVATRSFLRGPVSFRAEARGDVGALSALALEADFTRAALTLDAIGWAKAEGAPARGVIDFSFENGGIDLRRVALDGEGAALSGAARFGPDGLLETARFDRVYFDGAADLMFTLERAPAGRVEATLTGAYLNAGPALQSLIEAGPPPAGAANRERREEDEEAKEGALSIRARIDSVDLRAGAGMRDAALDLVRAGGELRTVDFSALWSGGAPVSVDLLGARAQGGERAVEARSGDIGALLAGVFGLTSVRGGEGSLALTLGAGGAVTGALAARDMRVVRAPLLARVLAAGSLTGLADLLNNQGIELQRAYAGFRFDDGVVTFEDARASGPSVGITVQGTVETGEGGVIDLHGAVAPAYSVNSILGAAPIIGDLFVNRQGEGVIALSYDIGGRADAPLVSVNPLSALTPGFLRRIFEDPPAPRAAPGETPEEAPAGEEAPRD